MASSPSSAPERMPSQQGVVSFQIKPSTGEKSKRGVAKHTKVIEKWSKQQKESEDVNEANERAEIVSTKQSTVLCLVWSEYGESRNNSNAWIALSSSI